MGSLNVSNLYPGAPLQDSCLVDSGHNDELMDWFLKWEKTFDQNKTVKGVFAMLTSDFLIRGDTLKLIRLTSDQNTKLFFTGDFCQSKLF